MARRQATVSGTAFRIASTSASLFSSLRDSRREREERQMFEKIWPGRITDGIMVLYRLAYRNYQ